MFDFFKKDTNDNAKPKESERVIENMKNIARSLKESGEDKKAFDMYKSITEVKDDADAFFQLGVLYAMGRGVEKNFLTAACNFKKAETLGAPDAAKMLLKAKLDYTAQAVENSDEEGIYNAMIQYANLIEADKVAKSVANEILLQYGNHLYNKEEYQKALKTYRAGAIYGDDGDCQYNIAIIYMKKSTTTDKDVAAILYWFDKAATNGIDDAKDRFEQIKETTKSSGLMTAIFDMIISSCLNGSEDIPKDNRGA